MIARLIRLGLALALVALVATGCGGEPSAKELIADTTEKTGALESFHIAIDTANIKTSGSGLNLTFVDGDVLVPDRLEGKVGGEFLGLSISTDLVVIGDTYYLNVPFTGWRTIDVDTLPTAFFDPENGILAVIEDADDLTYVDKEDVAGVSCYRVTGTVAAEDVENLLSTAEGTQELALEVWIGVDDELVHRVRLTGPIEPDEDADAVRTVELSQFDEPVEIEAPET